MAKGSQQFTWKIAPQIPRRCKWCDRPLRIRDVAEVRYSPEPWFKCTDCRTAELENSARRTRVFLAASVAGLTSCENPMIAGAMTEDRNAGG